MTLGPQEWALKQLLHRYFGEYLTTRISPEQMFLKLTEGFLELRGLEINVAAVNEKVRGPVELVDGYVGRVKVLVPGMKVMSEATEVLVEELQLTFRRAKCGGDTSLLRSISEDALASEVLGSLTQEPSTSEPNTVSSFFSEVVKAISSKFKLEIRKITVRFENESNYTGVCTALELRVDRVKFVYEKSAELERNKMVTIEGVSILTDIFSSSATSSQETENPGPLFLTSTMDAFYSCYNSLTPGSQKSEEPSEPEKDPNIPSDPISILEVPGPIRCLFRTNLDEKDIDKKKKAKVTMDLEVNVPEIKIFATWSQMKIVESMVKVLTPQRSSNPSSQRQMTKEDFRKMKEKIPASFHYQKALSDSDKNPEQEPQGPIITVKLKIASLIAGFPDSDLLAKGSMGPLKALELLRLDSKLFFTEKGYKRDHLLIEVKGVKIRTQQQGAMISSHMGIGSLEILKVQKAQETKEPILKTSDVSIDLKKTVKELENHWKINVNLGDTETDFDLDWVKKKLMEIKENKPFWEEEKWIEESFTDSCNNAPNPIVNLTFSCSSWLLNLKFGAGNLTENMSLIFKDFCSTFSSNPETLSIDLFASEVSGIIGETKLFHLSENSDEKLQLNFVMSSKAENHMDLASGEQETLQNKDIMIQSTFSQEIFQNSSIPGPFSQTVKSHSTRNGESIEILPPGNCQEMQKFLEGAQKSAEKKVKVYIPKMQVHFPKRSLLEKIKATISKFSEQIQENLKILGISERSQSPKPSFSACLTVENCAVLCDTENSTTSEPSQVALNIQNLYLGCNTDFLFATTSGFSIGSSASSSIPNVLGCKDFADFSKDKMEIQSVSGSKRDLLGVVVKFSTAFEPFQPQLISILLRNTEFQARPHRKTETFWGAQLLDLFGFKNHETVESDASTSPEIQLILENLHFTYHHHWIHPKSLTKLKAILTNGTIVKKESDPGLLAFLDGLKLRISHPEVPNVKILETGAIQIDLVENKVECSSDIVNVSVSADQAAILMSTGQELMGYLKNPKEEVLEILEKPKNQNLEIQNPGNIEQMILDAMNENYGWKAEQDQKEQKEQEDHEIRPSKIRKIEDQSPEQSPTFHFHLDLAKLRIAIHNNQELTKTTDAVIFKLQNLSITQKTFSSSSPLQATLHTQLGGLEIQDKVQNSNINQLLHPFSTAAQPNRTEPLMTFSIHQEHDKTGSMKVSASDMKVNLDQDTLEFLERLERTWTARLESERVEAKCVLEEQNSLILIDRFDASPESSSPKCTSDTTNIYYKHFCFSPSIKIHLDYQGKSRIPRSPSELHGILGSLLCLQGLPLLLERIDARNGFLGEARCLEYAFDTWKDQNFGNRANYIQRAVESYAPISPLVNLMKIPMKEYKKAKGSRNSLDVLKGVGKEFGALGVSGASGVLGMAQTVTGAVQSVVESTMISGPSGPSGTPKTIAKRSSYLSTFASATRATHNLLGGLKNQLRPNEHLDAIRKYKKQ